MRTKEGGKHVRLKKKKKNLSFFKNTHLDVTARALVEAIASFFHSPGEEKEDRSPGLGGIGALNNEVQAFVCGPTIDCRHSSKR